MNGERPSLGTDSRLAIPVTPTAHNQIVSCIWGIADDVLRDVYVRGKYRYGILPMTALRRLDALLEPTKDAVLEMKAFCDKEGIEDPDATLQDASGFPFHNTSKFTLRACSTHPPTSGPISTRRTTRRPANTSPRGKSFASWPG